MGEEQLVDHCRDFGNIFWVRRGPSGRRWAEKWKSSISVYESDYGVQSIQNVTGRVRTGREQGLLNYSEIFGYDILDQCGISGDAGNPGILEIFRQNFLTTVWSVKKKWRVKNDSIFCVSWTPEKMGVPLIEMEKTESLTGKIRKNEKYEIPHIKYEIYIGNSRGEGLCK